MKKIKLLTSLVGVTALAGVTIPTIASCSCSETASVTISDAVKAKGVSVKSSNIVQGKDSTIVFNLPSGKTLKSATVTVGGKAVSASNMSISSPKLTIKAAAMIANSVTINTVTLDVPVVSTGVCFTNNHATETSTINVGYCSNNGSMKFSTDGKTFETITSGTSKTIEPGAKFYLKADEEHGFTNMVFDEYGSNIVITGGSVSLEGSIDQLAQSNSSSENITYADKMFQCAFMGSTGLTSVTSDFLPSKNLSNYCYMFMFSGCTNLTSTPVLPATSLKQGCYYRMFNNCSNLTEAPELQAKTLAPDCYSYMFYGCSSLANAPELPATTLADNCYEAMFFKCFNLKNPPVLDAKNLANYCYFNMFAYSGLVAAPALPATTLTIYCYSQMFDNCTSLITMPVLSASTLVDGCYLHMFNKCSALMIHNDGTGTVFMESCPDTTPNDCVASMFSGTATGGYTSDPVKGGKYSYTKAE